jgi:L-alanine-DL-glutamate epimerase-like enolase superfamily enzyme
MSGPVAITDDIAEPGIIMDRGKATVLEKPGFGIDLDEGRVKRYQVDSITVR